MSIENARLIAAIAKNNRQTILVRRYTFNAHDMADFRVFLPEVKGGPPVRVTREGFSIRMDKLHELEAAIVQVMDEYRAEKT